MLARKISLAKWHSKEYFQPDEIGADAVTGCLRTSDNSLSWWRCTAQGTDVAEVALALVCNMQIFEKIDVFALPDTELEPLGIGIHATEGNTPVQDLRSRHVDLPHIDLERLSRLAKARAPRIRSGISVFTFTKRDLKTLVRDAVSTNRVLTQDLHKKLRRQLEEEAR